jgi:hypothetical protein
MCICVFSYSHFQETGEGEATLQSRLDKADSAKLTRQSLRVACVSRARECQIWRSHFEDSAAGRQTTFRGLVSNSAAKAPCKFDI